MAPDLTRPRLMVIPGDGVGNEVVPVAVALLKKVAPGLRVTEGEAGYGYFERHGVAMPADLLESIRRHDGVLFGATGTPSPPPAGYESPILAMRAGLGLHASIRYFRAPGGEGVDLVIARDIAEGLYAVRERDTTDGMIAEHLVTRAGTARLARVAAALARPRRGRVTVVHKANVLRRSEGLFRDVAVRTLEEEGVAWDESLADAAGYHLVLEPRRFDVMMANSHFGDLLSDVAAAMVGGLGVVPSLSVGDGPPLAEPVHGSAPDIAGRDMADPVAAVLSGAHLLDHWGLREPARRLCDAVDGHLRARAAGTAPAGTAAIAADIAARLESG